MSVRTSPGLHGRDAPNLPRGWIRVGLDEVSERINPGFACGIHNKERGGVPHLRPMNIDINGEIDLSIVKYVQTDSYDQLLKGDVLFNNTNSPELLGKTAYIKEDTNWAYSNHMTRIRPYATLVNSRWLALHLHTLFLFGFFKMNCVHHVNQASISSTFLAEKTSISIPPIAEQCRIVAKVEELFTKLDAGVKSLETIKSQLQEYRQSVLKSAFDGKLTEQWRRTHRNELEPASKLLEHLKEERKKTEKPEELASEDARSLPELPERWVWVTLDAVTRRITYGITVRPKYVEEGIPLISAREIRSGEIDLAVARKISIHDFEKLRDKCRLYQNDILFSKTGTIGSVARVKTSLKLCSSQNIAVLSPLINPAYLELVLRSPRIQELARRNLKVTAVGDLQLGALSRFPIPIPSEYELPHIVAEVERRLSVVDKLRILVDTSLFYADRLRQSILKQAYEGRLVRQDPSDEPPSVLLERIRSLKAQVIRDEKAKRPKENPPQQRRQK